MPERAKSNGLHASYRSALTGRIASLVFVLYACVVIGPGLAAAHQEAAMPDVQSLGPNVQSLGPNVQSLGPNVQSLGPQVGARAPDFTLSDHNGRSRTLRSLMGPRGLML